jgi:phosphoserine phosphatase
MSGAPIVGVVFDLDGTLAPDTTTQFLRAAGVDVGIFWSRVEQRMRDGWDQTLAYMSEWLAEAQLTPTAFIRDKMTAAASHMDTYPGVERLFAILRNDGKRLGVDIEFHLVSSGLRPIVEGLRFASEFSAVWASDFAYDTAGMPFLPKASLSFTDKTRSVVAISKGITQSAMQRDPFAVNRRVGTFRVPFRRMVYVGDGLTDVPVFALLTARGGQAVAVFDPADAQGYLRAHAFLDEERVVRVAPADYRRSREGLKAVRAAMMDAAKSVQRATPQAQDG